MIGNVSKSNWQLFRPAHVTDECVLNSSIGRIDFADAQELQPSNLETQTSDDSEVIFRDSPI